MQIRILAVALAGWMAGGGCSADGGPSVPFDAGPGSEDAGPSTVDAGPGPMDAGPGPMDAGPGPVDAGPVDPGTPINAKALAFSDAVTAITLAGDGTIYLGGRFTHAGTLTGGGVPLHAADGQPWARYPMATQVSAAVTDGHGGWYVAARFMVDRELTYGLAHITPQGEFDVELTPIEGIVRAIVVDDNIIYIGGAFTSVGGERRHGLAAVQDDGAVLAWNPQLDGAFGAEVRAMLVHRGILYIGGAFDSVDGQAVSSLAAFDGDGSRRVWSPTLTDAARPPRVFALAADGNQLYVGGKFATVDGQARTGLAAFGFDGQLAAWAPRLAGSLPSVSAMVFHRNVLYVAGDFSSIEGQDRSGLAAFGADGPLRTWAPTIMEGWTTSLAADDGVIYVGGKFKEIEGQHRLNVAAVSEAGVLQSWDAHLMPEREGCFQVRPCLNMYVSTVAAHGGGVYVGGNFRGMGSVVPRSGLAAVDARGALYAWAPHDVLDGRYISAVTASARTLFVATANVGLLDNGDVELLAFDRQTGALRWRRSVVGDVRALVVGGDVAYAGGSFSAIDGSPRRNLAALSATGELLTWAPLVEADGEEAAAVEDLAIHEGVVYAAGRFNAVDDQRRSNLAAIATDGTVQPWAPIAGAGSSIVSAIAVFDGITYVAGDFAAIDGQPRRLVAALAPDGTLLPWQPSVQGLDAGISLTAAGSVVYLAALSADDPTRTDLVAFDNTGTRLSWPNVDDWQHLNAMAAVPRPESPAEHVLFVVGQAQFSRFIGGGYFARINENGDSAYDDP